MKTENPVRLEMDLKKIFLTPPVETREKVTLFVLMIITFVMFFAPIIFTEIHPVKAIFLASLPAISISWGWMVLLRALFYKSRFSK